MDKAWGGGGREEEGKGFGFKEREPAEKQAALGGLCY